MRNKAKYTVIMLVTVLAMLIAGFMPQDQSRDFKIAKNLDIFFSLFRELNSFYVDDIDAEKLVRTGINEILGNLDPYTTYYSENELDDISFMTTGKYGGIGALIRKTDDYSIVTQIYKGFPADVAGIKPGDILKKVDNKSLKGLDSDKVSDNLKGDPGTSMEVTVERNGTEKVFTLKRERVAISPIPYYGMLDEKTAYIRFTSFTENCAQDVRNAFLSLKEKYKPAYLILDLRGNPGGLMSESAEIVNIFVGPGNNVVETKGKVKQFDTSYKTTKAAADESIPLVVLISRSSASAAEIVAGAIQDLDRGVIMGQRSFGKGLVQITRPLSYNGQLKVTTAKYYIPSGRCIQGRARRVFSHPVRVSRNPASSAHKCSGTRTPRKPSRSNDGDTSTRRSARTGSRGSSARAARRGPSFLGPRTLPRCARRTISRATLGSRGSWATAFERRSAPARGSSGAA